MTSFRSVRGPANTARVATPVSSAAQPQSRLVSISRAFDSIIDRSRSLVALHSRVRKTALPGGYEVTINRGFAGHVWLGGEHVLLPISAYLQPGDGEIVAFNPETGIFGSGVSPDEAVSDLRMALFDHLMVLRDEPQLSAELESQRTFLAQHLRA